MKRFKTYLAGGLLIAGTAFLAGSDSECEFDSDDGFDDDNGFDFDDDFFKPVVGDKDQSPQLLAATLYPLFTNA